jgi:hypothetical protein
VPTTHGLIEDRDHQLVVAIVLEDEEVPCHDLVAMVEPPPLASQVMSTHASVLVDSVGPPSAEVCRAAASFP